MQYSKGHVFNLILVSLSFVISGNMQHSMYMCFTIREQVNQLDYEGSQKAAPSIGQSEEVQLEVEGHPSNTVQGQMERYEKNSRGS